MSDRVRIRMPAEHLMDNSVIDQAQQEMLSTEDHSITAAIPGNILPSRYSSIAPPPVLT
jgi:hypothetical protein